MRYVNTETGEIFEAVNLERFIKAQERLSRQVLPTWRNKRQHQRWSRETMWWIRLATHLAPMVIFGAIAVALLLH